jgi:uncharacterized coiled-coil DUF342 family protein
MENLLAGMQLPETERQKKCAKCTEYLPLRLFNNSSASNDGKQSYCKYCQKIHKLEMDMEEKTAEINAQAICWDDYATLALKINDIKKILGISEELEAYKKKVDELKDILNRL